MSVLSKLESEISALPPNLRAEVLDFVAFVKQRHGLSAVPASVEARQDRGDSPFCQAVEAAGLVGCIETYEHLSTTYKNRLDFSAKYAILP